MQLFGMNLREVEEEYNKLKVKNMKTSNKLLLGLFIAVLIGITVNIILVRNALIEKINENVNPKIENVKVNG